MQRERETGEQTGGGGDYKRLPQARSRAQKLKGFQYSPDRKIFQAKLTVIDIITTL